MTRLLRFLPSFIIALVWCVFTLGWGQSHPYTASPHSSVGPQQFQGTNIVGDVPRATLTLTPNPVPLLFFHVAADESNVALTPSRLVITQYTAPCFATLRYYTHNLQLEGG